MPMSFSMYESWAAEDRSNMIPVRESRRSEEHRRRRYSTSASSSVAKVHINVLPPAETKKEVHYVPTYIPTPVIQPTPAPTYSIEATAEEIADRICAENTAKNRLSSLEARLEEEHALRMAAEHERGREAARRETEQILADRRARELLEREESARRRVAEEYQYSRSLGNSPRTSGEDLWSTVAVTSTTTREGRLVVHDHRHNHGHGHSNRSHSDSRDRRCSRCGHSGHRSRECPGETVYVPTNRVRHITYLS